MKPRAEDIKAWRELTPEQRAFADHPSRRMMYEDGVPLAVICLTPTQRSASWQKNPPRAAPRFEAEPRAEDPSTTAYKAALALRAAPQVRSKEKSDNPTPASPKSTRDGLIAVATLASEYTLLPREARAILRASSIAKPAQGWFYAAGTPLEATIRAALAAGKSHTKRERVAKTPAPGEAVFSGSQRERRKWQKLHATPATSSSSENVASPNSKSVSKRPSTSSKTKTIAKASRRTKTKSSPSSKRSSSCKSKR